MKVVSCLTRHKISGFWNLKYKYFWDILYTKFFGSTSTVPCVFCGFVQFSFTICKCQKSYLLYREIRQIKSKESWPLPFSFPSSFKSIIQLVVLLVFPLVPLKQIIVISETKTLARMKITSQNPTQVKDFSKWETKAQGEAQLRFLPSFL